jgi:hypothetical protein
MSQQDGQGRLLIKAAVGKRQAIQQRIHIVAQRAAATQPKRRVVSVDRSNGDLEVLTTSQKLAHRLAHELKKAFGGRVTYMWSDDNMLLAAWDQGVTPTASRRKAKTI